MKMPAKTKADWLAALRSGKYKQTRGRLENDGGYCCLGVLQCSVGSEIERDGEEVAYGIPSQKWLLKHDIRAVFPAIDELVNLNDKDRLSFEEIADWIEKHVEGISDAS